MKILIDFNCSVIYSSQYLGYLKEKFDVSFAKTPFDLLSKKGNLFLFSAITKNRTINYVIDFADSSEVNEQAYAWSDAYGKINFNNMDGKYLDTSKLVKIAPSFGVRIWGRPKILFYTLWHYLKFFPTTKVKNLFFNYFNQKGRLRLSNYVRHVSDNDYIFFISTLWNKQNHCQEEFEANSYRARFIMACKKIPSIHFEGGFAPNAENGIYADLFAERKVTIREYMDKISKSACVFNTPAVFSCHGWKLGEYLALGKAIISTPLKNELPVPLEHGVNVHFVSGEEKELIDAIKKICSDETYRIKLESGALQYWLDHGHPKNAIHSLFSKASDSESQLTCHL